MPRRLFRIVINSLSREPSRQPPTFAFALEDVVWAMGSFCALNRKPLDAELPAKQFPPPYTSNSFKRAGVALDFRNKETAWWRTFHSFKLPFLADLERTDLVKQPNSQSSFLQTGADQPNTALINAEASAVKNCVYTKFGTEVPAK